jgi:hypothetical protein
MASATVPVRPLGSQGMLSSAQGLVSHLYYNLSRPMNGIEERALVSPLLVLDGVRCAGVYGNELGLPERRCVFWLRE